ncbi:MULTISPECIES: PrsW family glutamic-type intramembrane protease [Pseudanabaena]|uniref:FHA domain containing protein n=2 Tax=Pseudanabaena TaxID=1152 RepID=L8N2S8_9CYAN|nr:MULTISPECIES: PrsW family glutamic-type intramembrane protease [Pseudanabaena]ELS33035.1 FHA domain containing protein [Pseudanabaena biceps PCC 7429]MDG3494758.1 PrsW family glutamic-type intramembrane protease [Pseudanabaena catenata USMAC16]
MYDRLISTAFLRQISNGRLDRDEIVATLGDRSVTLGRDPSCEVAIDINIYGAVSRRHAEIRAIFAESRQDSRPRVEGWEIYDLDSANGTFINNRRLYGCCPLQHGDRIQLTKDGPQFLFELATPVTSLESELRQRPQSQITSITFTKLLPIFSTGNDLWKQDYLLPGITTVGFVVMMFAFLGQPQLFNLTISLYISLAAYYFVYQLCGKKKPWWIILGAALVTVLILRSPILNIFLWFFYQVLPGATPKGQVSFISVLIAMFFGAGLMEELIKSLPVFILWFVGLWRGKKWRSRVGISEPLDGILIGAASAIGFTLTETLGLYVPNIVQSITTQAGSTEIAELTGLQLLIPRVLGSVAGHMAYSGYFGYFIGLSIMKPSLRWQILTIGYLSSAFLHALWNTSALVSFWLLAIVGGISYAFLVAAILKAHSFSSKV